MQQQPDIQKQIKEIINQIFEIEQKSSKLEGHSIQRNINRLKELFESGLSDTVSISYHNPIGEKYDETRTDCEASISGESTENLVVIEVIKPIIRISQNGITHIVQKGIVVAESQKP